MLENNPYSAPQTGPGFVTTSDRNRIWSAYLIAPFFTPMFGAIAVSMIGFYFQFTQAGNVDFDPMSLIFAPICLMIVGVPCAYGIAGLVGMPSVYWLQARGRLNGGSIHGLGLICAAVPAVIFAMIGLLMIIIGKAPVSEFGEILLSSLVAFLVLTPFSLLSATVFWWIGVRKPARRP